VKNVGTAGAKQRLWRKSHIKSVLRSDARSPYDAADFSENGRHIEETSRLRSREMSRYQCVTGGVC
jgi:hypothetical protein